MAYKHQLSLEVPDTNNCSVFRIVDTSIYDEHVPVTCTELLITSPGYNQPVVINPIQGFNLILNGCTLGIQTGGCGTVSEVIPDGIYTIRYSISPNDKVFVEYNYLRITAAVNKYYNIYCNVNLSGCEPLQPERDKLTRLRLLRSMLDGAKAKVEFCHNNDQGMAIYNYALAQLDKLSCSYCK